MGGGIYNTKDFYPFSSARSFPPHSLCSQSFVFSLTSLSSSSLFRSFLHSLHTSLIFSPSLLSHCSEGAMRMRGQSAAFRGTIKAENCLPLFPRADPLPEAREPTVPHLSQGGTSQESRTEWEERGIWLSWQRACNAILEDQSLIL